MARKIFAYAILVLLLLIPVILWLSWEFRTKKPMDILIVDKTVPNKKYQEHRGIHWILTHLKYVKPGGDLYNEKEDYYGFHPGDGLDYEIRDFEGLSRRGLDSVAGSYDMAYIADVYGVYYNDWYLKDNLNEFSRLIHGGLDQEEIGILEHMQADKKLLVAEFNFLGHPTSGKVRKRAQELFGFHWTGWTARYFSSLDTTGNEDLPKWVVRLYTRNYGQPWDFTKSGVVFVHENQRICILENETHLKKEIPLIRTPEVYTKEFGIPAEICYAYWFDIIVPNDSINETLSGIHVFPNAEGSKLLRDHGLSTVYPAAVRNRHDHLTWYFSGDFCDNEISFHFVRFSGISGVHKLLSKDESNHDREYFFWSYYYPVMKKVLEKYHNRLNQAL
ncbi:MAG: hypothetical protein R6T99_10230 [Bacteroidales bacterium]